MLVSLVVDEDVNVDVVAKGYVNVVEDVGAWGGEGVHVMRGASFGAARESRRRWRRRSWTRGRFITRSLPALRFGVLHFLEGFLAPVGRVILFIRRVFFHSSSTLRFGILHFPNRFLAPVSRGIVFLWEFVDVTIWDPAFS